MSGNESEIGHYASEKPGDYFGHVREEMLEFLPASFSRVLEVGCSSGAFGAAIKREFPGAVVVGIEPEYSAAAAAARRLDRVICGSFSTAVSELNGEKFDVLVFNDVLEHLPDPDSALADCRSLLSPEGMVVASIPNVLFFYHVLEVVLDQDWRYREAGILDSTHLRFFTRKSIQRMFKEAGFQIEKIGGINAFAGWKYRIANVIAFGYFSDWKFTQFGIRARLKNAS